MDSIEGNVDSQLQTSCSLSKKDGRCGHHKDSIDIKMAVSSFTYLNQYIILFSFFQEVGCVQQSEETLGGHVNTLSPRADRDVTLMASTASDRKYLLAVE